MAKKARDVMSEDCECIGENASVTEAREEDGELDVGSLPICGDDDRLKGDAHRPRHRRQGARAGQGPGLDQGGRARPGQAGHDRRRRLDRGCDRDDEGAQGPAPAGDRRARPRRHRQPGRPRAERRTRRRSASWSRRSRRPRSRHQDSRPWATTASGGKGQRPAFMMSASCPCRTAICPSRSSTSSTCRAPTSPPTSASIATSSAARSCSRSRPSGPAWPRCASARVGRGLLVAGHIEGEAPVLLYRVADLDAGIEQLEARGLEVSARFGFPHGDGRGDAQPGRAAAGDLRADFGPRPTSGWPAGTTSSPASHARAGRLRVPRPEDGTPLR